MKKNKSQKKLNVWIHGATGRMGREIQKAILESRESFLISGGSSRVFEGEFFYQGQPVTVDKLHKALEKTDVIIDFSTAEAHDILIKTLQKGLKQKVAVLIGTTGLSTKQIDFWEKNAKKMNLSVLFAPNTSLGILALNRAIKIISNQLSGFDIAMEETHHTKKKDAPSGTAKLLAKAANFPEKDIASFRIGGVVGEHTIRFVSQAEEISMTHRAFSRALFAQGALTLTKWIAQQPSGSYSLDDVEF